MTSPNNLSMNSTDFLPQFKAIGQSLKKRFFRKPNVADAIEQYESLSQELLREGQKEFTAVCWLEASRCQESLQNPIQQANLLTKAGKLLLENRNVQCYFESFQSHSNLNPPFSLRDYDSCATGNLQLALQCLTQASQVYKSQNNIGLSILITLLVGETLFREGDCGEALKYFKSALCTTRLHYTVADQIVVAELVINVKIRITEYESASKTVNDYLILLKNVQEDLPREWFVATLRRFEIMRVCLILILGVNSADVIRYVWPGTTSNDEEENLSAEQISMQCQLKSLVLAVQHGSVEEIQFVKNHLAPLILETQNVLFNVLIQMHSY